MNRKGRKVRLDQLLQEKRPELSRSRLQAEIMAGKVLVNGKVCDKPGFLVKEDASIEIREPENPYVSRGGLKLEGALKDFKIEVQGFIVLDVGASTGGFTDCFLKNGAKLVYALDVSYGQLDYSLRGDSRVVMMERWNIRYLGPADINCRPDLATIDVSFISLKKVLPVMESLTIPELLALVKPQFEAGRADVSRGEGVIRNPALHKKILSDLIIYSCENNYCFKDITVSQYPGPKGNLEYFLYLTRKSKEVCNCSNAASNLVNKTVDEAHRRFLRKNN
ncbi:MAG: TlyA family RNA methyltransferase [Bacillota bacterium]